MQDFPESALRHDDDEKWLDISPEELEGILNSRMETPSGNQSKEKKDPTKTFDQIVNSVNTFMNGVSGYEGIETEIDPGKACIVYNSNNSKRKKKMKNWVVMMKKSEN